MENMERKWRNPNDVMKSMRKKKLQRKASLRGGVVGNKENSPVKSVDKSGDGVRIGKKRSAALEDSENCCNLLNVKTVEPDNRGLCSPSRKKFRGSCLSEVFSNVDGGISEEETLSAEQVDLPLDVSLKSKARFTSLHPFTWTASVKTHQEAEGITEFVRNQSSAEERSSDAKSEFQRNLMIWVHPSLPFMKLFPRIETKVSTAGQQFTWLPDQQVLGSLKEDWCTSFRSVFQLLRMGHCPYFYLCANHFTVLFVSADVMGCAHTTALLAPTTGGFRQALRKEGVEFTLPLASDSHPKAEEPSDTLEDSEHEDESAASTWLCSMGIGTQDFPAAGTKDFPAADTQKIAFQRSPQVNIDNHPESVVRVEATHVHALFNFLLNSKTTVTTTGAHAGIPPTLIAPVAFEGGTLKSLKAKHSTVQEHIGGRLRRLHSVDISGPILPQTLHNFSTLFQRTQHGNFKVYMNCIESTGSFNAALTHASCLPSPPPHAKRFNCYKYQYLNSKLLPLKSGLRELLCKNYLYTWS